MRAPRVWDRAVPGRRRCPASSHAGRQPRSRLRAGSRSRRGTALDMGCGASKSCRCSYPALGGTAPNRGETHLRDGPEPGQSVAGEADLLALRKGARGVVHWKLDGDIPLAHQLHDKLDIKIEAVANEINAKQGVAAKHFEHREWVGHFCVQHEIYRGPEKRMSEIKDGSSHWGVFEFAHFPAALVPRA